METLPEEQGVVNENFKPSDRQEKLLAVLKAGRDAGEPWGWASVKRFEEETGVRKQYVNRSIQGLVDAGWVKRVYRGLYKFVEDPREDVSEGREPFIDESKIEGALDDMFIAVDSQDREAAEDAANRIREAVE